MNKICTSLEQSKKLLKLGIDINTADMYYQYYTSFSPLEGITEGHWEIPVIGSWKMHHISIPDPAMPNADIPAWSLSALLELMPQTIGKDDKWLLRLQRCYHRYVSRFICTYPNMKSTSICDNPLDAAFEMVCWLKENGKL